MTRATTCAPVNIHDVSWVIRDLVGSNRQLGQPPSFLTALADAAIRNEEVSVSEDPTDSDGGGVGRRIHSLTTTTHTTTNNNNHIGSGATHGGGGREAGYNTLNNKKHSGDALLSSMDQQSARLAVANVLRLARGQGVGTAETGHASDGDAATAAYGASMAGLVQRRQQPAGTASLSTLAHQQYPTHQRHQHHATRGARVAFPVTATASDDTDRIRAIGLLSAQVVGAINEGDGGRLAFGSGNGTLSTAELQAIATVCGCLTGPSLSFAVQGIMAHVATHHPSGSSSGNGSIRSGAPVPPPLFPSSQTTAVGDDIKADCQALPGLQAKSIDSNGVAAGANGAQVLPSSAVPACNTPVCLPAADNGVAEGTAAAATIAIAAATAVSDGVRFP